MRGRGTPALIAAAALTTAVQPGWAQNISGVFGPIVKPGTAQAQYRIGLRPGEDGAPDSWRQRAQIQVSERGDLLWRVLVETTGSEGRTDFDLMQTQLFWDLSPDGRRWRTGLRFDAVLRNGDQPEQVNFNWTNQIALTERWNTRFVVRASRQFGDRAADGLGFETRATVFTTRGAVRFGVETYNIHGQSVDFRAFSGRQQVGPFAFWPVADDWSLLTGVLFGANDRAPDADFRLFLGRRF